MIKQRAPGILIACAVGVACVVISRLMPVVSALLIAIIIGMLAGNLRIVPTLARDGLAWVSKPLLRVGIMVLGLQLSLQSLADLGAGGVIALMLTVAATFAGTLVIGQILGVTRVTRYLIATGFAICGASAVAAMSVVVDPDQESDDDVAQAIALVTIFGTVLLFALPLLQPVVGFNDHQMGIWIGASVHEVAQVVAAASAVSASALAIATVAKLGRVVLLAPLVAGVGLVLARRRVDEFRSGYASAKERPPLVPVFVIGFLVAILVRTFVPLGEWVVPTAGILSTTLLAIAMFALGVAVDLRQIVRTGGRALLLGAVSTCIAVIVSFTTIGLLT